MGKADDDETVGSSEGAEVEVITPDDVGEVPADILSDDPAQTLSAVPPWLAAE